MRAEPSETSWRPPFLKLTFWENLKWLALSRHRERNRMNSSRWKTSHPPDNSNQRESLRSSEGIPEFIESSTLARDHIWKKDKSWLTGWCSYPRRKLHSGGSITWISWPP